MGVTGGASPGRREAGIRYLHADFQMIRPGDHVSCGVTGQPIAISELLYWDVAAQMALFSADVAFERLIASNQP